VADDSCEKNNISPAMAMAEAPLLSQKAAMKEDTK
jgi:hypothetical protein